MITWSLYSWNYELYTNKRIVFRMVRNFAQLGPMERLLNNPVYMDNCFYRQLFLTAMMAQKLVNLWMKPAKV